MKKMRIFIFLVLILLLVNCGKEEEKTKVAIEESNVEKSQVVAKIEDEEIRAILADETFKLLETFSENKKEIIEKLKTLNKEESNQLLFTYISENTSLLERIDATINADDRFENITEEGYDKLVKFFEKNEIILLDGPGKFWLAEFPDFYHNIFKEYVSEEYKEYLELTSKYKDRNFILIGTMDLSQADLGERIGNWEEFLLKYPNNVFKEDIEGNIVYYVQEIGYGLTSYKDNGEIYISEENLKEYNRFIEEHPNTRTTKALKYLLKHYKEDDVFKKMLEIYGIKF